MTRLRRLLDGSPEACAIHSQNAIRYANPAMLRMLGFETFEQIADSVQRDGMVHPDDSARLLRSRCHMDAGDHIPSVRVRWRKRNGEFVAIEGIRTTIDFEGAPAALVRAYEIRHELLLSAIEAERVETSLRESEAQNRSLFEQSPLAVWMFDAESLQIIIANQAASRLYGYDRDEFLDLKVSRLRVATERFEMVRDLEKLKGAADSVWRGIRTHRKKDGSTFRVDLIAYSVPSDSRQMIFVIGTDVTELEWRALDLLRNQKLDAIRQLATGVAHEINNALAVVLSVSDTIRTELASDHPLQPEVREIEIASRRGATVMQELLAFTRDETSHRMRLLLDELMVSLENTIARALPQNTAVSFSLASTGNVHVDPDHLTRVVLHLVSNASDAMPSGGSLLIRTGNTELSDPDAREMSLSVGAYATISVSDTGVGMDAAKAAHLFEPFFTTKEVGKATGLGLSAAFGMIRLAGGAISVRSQLGGGTTFLVLLPVIFTRRSS